MTELDQWKNDLSVYNDEYEKIALKVKDLSNQAFSLVSEFKPLTSAQYDTLSSVGVALSVQLQRLVESRAEAAYNFRGVKNFYERTIIERKLGLMRSSREKKIAAGVAENEAVQLSTEEFELMNEAERYADVSDKRWETTERLIASIQTKLSYGQHP